MLATTTAKVGRKPHQCSMLFYARLMSIMMISHTFCDKIKSHHNVGLDLSQS